MFARDEVSSVDRRQLFMEHNVFHPVPERDGTRRPGLLQWRFTINRDYLLSLSNANLLQNYYLEAALSSIRRLIRLCGRRDS